MKWPWVSVRALEIREQQLESVTKELDALKLKYDKLMNSFVHRATGAPLDPDLLPETYRRRLVTPKQEELDPLNDPKEKKVPTRNVRDRIAEMEAERIQKFMSATTKVTAIDEKQAETA